MSTVNLYDYTKGRVVRAKHSGEFYGHIVGFDQVYFERGQETIIKVLWQDGEVQSIHPLNVELG
jgi:hypothetical protein